jgi:GGDEF domain-containing protein
LVALAAPLRQHLVPSDTLVRFGGDEFAVLLPEIANVDVAVDIAQQLGQLLRSRPLPPPFTAARSARSEQER